MATSSSRSHLRRFGFTVGTGLAIIGLISWYRGHTDVPRFLWAVATTLGVLALVLPAVLAPVEKVWMGLATALGWLNTRIILGLLFFLVITPVGLVMRLFRDPLDRGLKEGNSYWKSKESTPFDPKSYEKQF